MALLRFIVIVAALAVVSGHPDVLQGHYGTPSGGASGQSGAGSSFVSTNSDASGSSGANFPVVGETVNDSAATRLEGNFDTVASGSDLRSESISNSSPLRSLAVPSDSFSFDDGQSNGISFPSGSASSPGSNAQRLTISSGGSVDDSPLITSSINSAPGFDFTGAFGSNSQNEITITREITEDVYTTVTNVFYNSVPVTLTEFMKTTAVAPTLQVVTTAVDDKVFVATAPVTRTDTVTVVDTRTAHQFATEVSTDLYTITHRAYNIQQQLVTSTVVQTQVFRPTVVSTRIDTEYDTQTVVHTVTNTVVVDAGTGRANFNHHGFVSPHGNSPGNQLLVGGSLSGGRNFQLQQQLELQRQEQVRIQNAAFQNQNSFIGGDNRHGFQEHRGSYSPL